MREAHEKTTFKADPSISDYWILDVNTRQVYVFRQPTPDGYQQEAIFAANTMLAPVAFPDITIPLNQVFLPNVL